MLTVSEALDLICAEVVTGQPDFIPLVDAFGLHLAADVIADVDSPPFDKALMDGYAVIHSDIHGDSTELLVGEEVTAGRVPTISLTPGKATRIMTGAPLPDGTTAVVKVEETQSIENGTRVRILTENARPGQNLIRQGTNKQAGDPVVAAGGRLRPQEIGALAEMGTAEVVAIRSPKVAVLATGDELVAVTETPGPGQIRNSNESMLVAQIQQAGAIAVPLGIARDDRADLRNKITAGLKNDFLLLSGGVSAGKLDLVPSELEHAGVRQVFHKVQVKPGKPIWFGVLHGQGHTCFVFGLPGNPVSSMVCFELFVRTALRKYTGNPSPQPRREKARLTHDHIHKDNRETFHPAVLTSTEGELQVELLPWQGSSDLQSTTKANSMAVLPAEPRNYQPHDLIDVVRW